VVEEESDDSPRASGTEVQLLPASAPSKVLLTTTPQHQIYTLNTRHNGLERSEVASERRLQVPARVQDEMVDLASLRLASITANQTTGATTTCITT
jgi:hypothetical protein